MSDEIEEGDMPEEDGALSIAESDRAEFWRYLRECDDCEHDVIALYLEGRRRFQEAIQQNLLRRMFADALFPGALSVTPFAKSRGPGMSELLKRIR